MTSRIPSNPEMLQRRVSRLQKELNAAYDTIAQLTKQALDQDEELTRVRSELATYKYQDGWM